MSQSKLLTASRPAHLALLATLCRPLSPELRRRVQQRWAQFYRDFGYTLEEEEGNGIAGRQF